MIDWERLGILRNEVGPESFDEVVALFTEEVEEVTSKLHQSCDPATLEDELHFLKGSALSFGFSMFAEMCQIGETLAAQGKQDEVAIGPILNCYRASLDQFTSEVGEKFA